MNALEGSFREVMAGVCTPVCVVTALADGRPHGTTVSAFASLSLRPPMVLVALDRESDLLALIRARYRFGVNVLASSQARLAAGFARKGRDKFAGVAWRLDHGLPRLEGATGWLACDVGSLVPGGDHIVALGHVRIAERSGGAPLTYHQRRYGTHAALNETFA